MHALKDVSQDRAAPASGQGMDRQTARKQPIGMWAVAALALVSLLMLAAWLVSVVGGGRTLSVNPAHIMVSSVSRGTFQDFIPLRGRLIPRSTVYLDAIEGGRVEQVLVEDGALVNAGDPIAILSNTNLQLEVLGREASVTEQLNNIRSIELQLEQNRLSHKRNLVEIEYQIKRLSRSIERQQSLATAALVSKSTLEDLQDELQYFKSRREVTLESQATDTRMQEQQLLQLRQAGEQLQTSLQFARKNLADLSVRAPVTGKLSGFSVEVGESIRRGGRLGQIDDPDGFKLRVSIDEFYLGRVDLGQTAEAELAGTTFWLSIAKIYPQVSNGQFEVDMIFNEEPKHMRRGQTLQAQLSLGDDTPALLIPNGSFYQQTGGRWIFVVQPDGSEAVRRNVRMGRRNTDFIEVLDGLEIGERVITSPYTSYVDMDRITLDRTSHQTGN
ncbi:MAG: efflux RND transporter periplasmic adaptor subunit [Pseudomonadota bacterium]